MTIYDCATELQASYDSTDNIRQSAVQSVTLNELELLSVLQTSPRDAFFVFTYRLVSENCLAWGQRGWIHFKYQLNVARFSILISASCRVTFSSRFFGKIFVCVLTWNIFISCETLFEVQGRESDDEKVKHSDHSIAQDRGSCFVVISPSTFAFRTRLVRLCDSIAEFSSVPET